VGVVLPHRALRAHLRRGQAPVRSPENDHGPAVACRAAIPLTVIAVPGCTVGPSVADSGYPCRKS